MDDLNKGKDTLQTQRQK